MIIKEYPVRGKIRLPESPKSRLGQKLKMEVKFAAAAANFADFNIKIGANVARARHGGEICRGGGKFRRLLHASERL